MYHFQSPRSENWKLFICFLFLFTCTIYNLYNQKIGNNRENTWFIMYYTCYIWTIRMVMQRKHVYMTKECYILIMWEWIYILIIFIFFFILFIMQPTDSITLISTLRLCRCIVNVCETLRHSVILNYALDLTKKNVLYVLCNK